MTIGNAPFRIRYSVLIVAPPCERAVPFPTDLSASGWHATRIDDRYAAIAALRLSAVALLWLSSALPAPDKAALVAAIADLPAPVPVMIVDPAGPGPTAADLRHAAIPSRVAPRVDPLTRLTPLLGRDGITDLLTRFRDRLARLLAAPDPYAIGEGVTPAALAHRIGGLAGTLDFPLLSAAWLRVETDGPGHLPAAWAETRIVHAMLERLLSN